MEFNVKVVELLIIDSVIYPSSVLEYNNPTHFSNPSNKNSINIIHQSSNGKQRLHTLSI
jgi:hypothetical protein